MPATMAGLLDFRRVEDPQGKVLHRLVRQLARIGESPDVDELEWWAELVLHWPKTE